MILCPSVPLRFLVAALCLVALGLAGPPARAEVPRLAFVQADGTLKVGGKIVRLYGIYIPPSERTCRTFLQPVRCAPRAVLELDRKVHGFVVCDEVGRNPDGTVSAVCSVREDGPSPGARQDLAAYLLRQGWAVALPDAPFAYHVLEEIARVNRRGIWAFQADSVRLP